MEEKKLVPKLRFPGFTEPWEQRKLGECMSSFTYGLNAAAKDYDGMHKYIRITDIDDETHNFIQSNLSSPDIDFNMDVSDYKLNIGDIVFARTGASVGKTYLYNPNDGDLYYAGFLIRGKVKEECDAGFIYQNTLTKEYDSFIRITSQRSGQPGVNSKEYATFRLNIPCKDEQEKISKVLNSLDELFTLHQRKLEHLKLKKKSLLQKLFPKEGSVNPELRFPGFTDPWEQRKLGNLYKRVNERNDGSLGRDKWISVAKMYFQDPDKVQSNNLDTRTYVMKKGDIAFEGHPNNEFKFGRFVLNDIGTGIISELFPIYRPITEYDLDFWKYAIQLERVMAPIFAKSITSSGNSSNKLDHNHFLNQKLLVPNIEEQKKIGTLLSILSKNITLHQRKLEHLQLLKKALLQQLFV